MSEPTPGSPPYRITLRGRCMECGASIPVRKDGTIGRHHVRRTPNLCPGIGQAPRELLADRPFKPRSERLNPLMDRFLAKVNKDGPPPAHRPELGSCWIWTGGCSPDGYGIAYLGPRGKRQDVAHRVAYREWAGPIPDGLVLDHLCSVRSCVNPAHLEPVTQKENVLRAPGVAAANVAKEECPQGHPYSGENLRITGVGSRACRQCERDKGERKRRARGAPKRKFGSARPANAQQARGGA